MYIKTLQYKFKYVQFLTVENLSAMQKTRFDLWVWKIPWRREW